MPAVKKKPYRELEEETRQLQSEVNRLRGLLSHTPLLLRAGPVLIDRLARTVTLDGEQIHLEPRVYRLLELLLLHKGSVVSSDTISTALWGDPTVPAASALGVYIHRLRKCLGPAGALIEVVRGHGYTVREESR